MKIFNVIMAGGVGSRFWPLSREANPKQFLNLSGNDLLINETINRLNKISSKENLFIVTNKNQSARLKEVTKDICLERNILIEPLGRNTAVAICYAAFSIINKCGDGIMCIHPSDHFIKNEKEFINIVNKGIQVAQDKDKLVTIGIKPTFPSTGYGYISFDKNKCLSESAHEVLQFVEKPIYSDAIKYLESGKYVWNSGIFIWKASRILEEFKRYLPKIYYPLEELSRYFNTKKEIAMIEEIYSTIPSISIDYGIMERSNNVAVVLGDFEWSDIGSWDALYYIKEIDNRGNVENGECVLIDVDNSIIYSEKKLVATVGIKDLIIVSTNDVTMVCSKERAQDVKYIVEKLRGENKVNYL